MINKIAIVGNAGSGKDLSIRIIVSILSAYYSKQALGEFRYKILRFADPIKSCISGFLGCSIMSLNGQSTKSQTLPENWYSENKPELTIRDLHLVIGDAMKQAFNPDIFATTLIQRVDPQQFNFVADLRYPNEAAILKVNGFTVIKITRNTDEPKINHSSEQYIDDIKADFQINNNATIKELQQKLIICLNEMMLISDEFAKEIFNSDPLC